MRRITRGGRRKGEPYEYVLEVHVRDGVEFYDAHRVVIWEMLADDADDLGMPEP